MTARGRGFQPEGCRPASTRLGHDFVPCFPAPSATLGHGNSFVRRPRRVVLMASPSRFGRHLAPALLVVPLLLAGGCAVRLTPSPAGSAQPLDAKPAHVERTPWTTSRVVGSPD